MEEKPWGTIRVFEPRRLTVPYCTISGEQAAYRKGPSNKPSYHVA
jgi:hypothetical protein